MKYQPCICCKVRNAIPTSKRGFCARCEEVVRVIDYLVKQEQAEAEKVAKRKATGLILPSDLKQH